MSSYLSVEFLDGNLSLIWVRNVPQGVCYELELDKRSDSWDHTCECKTATIH